MDFDTEEKRASVIGIGLPFRLVLPIASGTIDQGARQHVLGVYSGVLANAVAVEIVIAVQSVASLIYQSGSVRYVGYQSGSLSFAAYQSGSKASRVYP